MSCFLSDVRFADARQALSVAGFPQPDVKISEKPPMSADELESRGVLGSFNPADDTLWRAPGAASLLAAVHEYAHAIWWSARDDKALQRRINAVLDAIDRTDTVRGWVADSSDWLSSIGGDYGYLLDANELWARAIAQYVFTVSNQRSNYRKQWRDFMSAEPLYQEMQWPARDFAPVAAAIDANFPS